MRQLRKAGGITYEIKISWKLRTGKHSYVTVPDSAFTKLLRGQVWTKSLLWFCQTVLAADIIALVQTLKNLCKADRETHNLD